MGDGLKEAPEERLREGPSVSLPSPAPSLRADVLALDTVDEDGLQGTAEEVSITILAGDHSVWRYVSLLQGLERSCQLLFDLRDNVSHRENIGKLRCGSEAGWQITSMVTNNTHERHIFMCSKADSQHISCFAIAGVMRNIYRDFNGYIVTQHDL